MIWEEGEWENGARHWGLSQPLFPCTTATVSLDYSKEIKYGNKLCQTEGKKRGKRILLILTAKPFILHAPAKRDLSSKQIAFLLLRQRNEVMSPCRGTASPGALQGKGDCSFQSCLRRGQESLGDRRQMGQKLNTLCFQEDNGK